MGRDPVRSVAGENGKRSAIYVALIYFDAMKPEIVNFTKHGFLISPVPCRKSKSKNHTSLEF